MATSWAGKRNGERSARSLVPRDGRGKHGENGPILSRARNKLRHTGVNPATGWRVVRPFAMLDERWFSKR
ncbi:MAG TPA: hypothetical protein VMY42_12395 [Thermoguttaceae bacterium]|nr:hypothetical protein [Thermoguttaceae bacterium]